VKQTRLTLVLLTYIYSFIIMPDYNVIEVTGGHVGCQRHYFVR
jgi:hypothetical protein